ncbi:MAG: hypothetical protein RLZZ127_2263, partial [Planctomycetota bacterium]
MSPVAKRACERRRTGCGGRGACVGMSATRRARERPGAPRPGLLLAGRIPPPSYRRLAVLAPNTGCGKSFVTGLIVRGLREAGERTWVHKPVSCGDWDGTRAGDGRALADLAGDGQSLT